MGCLLWILFFVKFYYFRLSLYYLMENAIGIIVVFFILTVIVLTLVVHSIVCIIFKNIKWYWLPLNFLLILFLSIIVIRRIF